MNRFFSKIPVRQMPELDAIRFFSILLVVLHHQFMQGNFFLKWFHDHGWIGVDIFFVMSGFLITSLLNKEVEISGTINLKSFWYRRILRLWPSWLLTLILSIIMTWGLSSAKPQVREVLNERWWHYFFHFGNYSISYMGKIHTLFSHFWSLAVEEHFYLVWPVILCLLPTRKSAISFIIFLLIASAFVRYHHWTNGYSADVIQFATHTRIDEILFGCLLSYFFHLIKPLSGKTEMMLSLLLFSLFGLAIGYLYKNQTYPILSSLSYSVIGIATCLLIVIALKGSYVGLRRVFRVPLLAKLGVLSYGVYLIHLHVNYVVFPIAIKLGIEESQTFLAFLNFVLPFIPAYLMYFYVDEFFSKFKNKVHKPLEDKISLEIATKN